MTGKRRTRDPDVWTSLASAWPDLKCEREVARDIRSIADRVILRAGESLNHSVPYHPVVQKDIGLDRYRAICLCFLLFARDSFDALTRLLAARLPVQAKALTRALFEANIELIYISAKPADRALKFATFLPAAEKRYQDAVGRFAPHLVDPKRKEKVDAEYEPVRGLHGDAKGQPRRTWCGMTFEQLCKHAEKIAQGWGSLYPLLWVGHSGYVHASPLAVLQYDPGNPKEMRTKAADDPVVASGDLLAGSYLLFAVTWITDKAFSLGFDKKLSDWRHSVERLAADLGNTCGERLVDG